MTLLAGDLTTPARYAQWIGPGINPAAIPSVIGQLITSQTAQIYSKLSRARLFSQNFTRVFDGQGTYQIILPDWPVTNISLVQVGSSIVNPAPLPTVTNGVVNSTNSGTYGYRYVGWGGNLPGDPSVLEFVNGSWWPGVQNIQVTYTAGYLISNEAWSTFVTNQVTVLQPLGIWCRDNGVINTTTGAMMTPVASSPGPGQYVPPPDTSPGLYTFNAADVTGGLKVSISYSFIPADLEEACCQMVAERYSYRGRIGEISRALGTQETVRFMRGGLGRGALLPPEVLALIDPYVSTIPPAIGAPV